MSETATEQVAATHEAYETAATRPAVASMRARRGAKTQRKVTRYTLDLEANQHQFLRLWALSQGGGVQASNVMRCLLYLLEADESLQQRVYDELFADEED